MMKASLKKGIAVLMAFCMVFGILPVTALAEDATEVASIVLEGENYDSHDLSLKVMSSSSASGGKYVGDFKQYRCVSYNIQVEKAGNYQVVVRAATTASGATVLVNCCGSFSEETSVPNTGGWQTYQDVQMQIWMEEGPQVVTVTNLSSSAWNLDKITLNYVDDVAEPKNLKEYSTVYLENRWKSQRLVERNGVLQYAETSDSDYDDSTAAWSLIPDGAGFYEIQNANSGNYVVMTPDTDVVSLSAEGGTDAGKWQIGALGGRLEFYNKLYTGACITLEYQESYPDQVLASTASLAKWYSSQWAISVPEFAHEYTIGGSEIDGTAGTAVSTDGTSITVDRNGTESSWTLSQDISGAPVFTAEKMPIMEAVYNLSMEETYKNIHNGTYGQVFWTGTNWSKVWTRDSAISEQYSLSWIFPEITKNSIMEKIIGGTDSPQVWEQDTGTGGSYPSSVDRVILMIACWEYYKSTGDEEFLELAYEVTKNTLEQDYHVAYDEISGLMKGETGGLDHRDKTYPDWMSEKYEDSIIHIAESKAGNANVIFAQVLNLMAQSGQILGKDEAEIADWQTKYEDLKAAINDRLWLEDRGMYASWEYPEYMGSPVADKVDVLANGYAVMFGISDEERTQSILENYPLVTYGANTVWPQKTGRQFSAIYHNRGVWPGWEATLMIGAKENGNNQVAEEVFKSCVRGAAMNLSNYEVINYATGEGCHSTQQLWSVAATLSGYYRVLFGMTYNTDGVRFAPYVPEWMEGPFSLTNYAYRDAVLNITVSGTGDTISAMTVNGEHVSADYVLPTNAAGEYNIVIEMTDSGNRSNYHLEEDSWVICPNMPVLTENEDGTLTWEENAAYTYKLWTGSEYVAVSGGSYTPDRSVYGVYSLVAVDKNGITSEMSKPIVIVPAGDKTVYEAEDGEYAEECFEDTAAGFTGTGYVVDKLKAGLTTDLAITVNVEKSGRYDISTIYNNYGNATTGQDGGIRSIYVDGVDVGTMAFPIVNFDFQPSSHLYVVLTKGTHVIEIRYNADDWYDTNMTTARGTTKNDVCYDSMTLVYLGEDALSGEKEAAIAELNAARAALEDSLYRGEEITELDQAVSHGVNAITLAGTSVEMSAALQAALEALDAVMTKTEALIHEIGTVTVDSGEAIEAARNAYDALTEEQKALVSNYQTLLNAEHKYMILVAGAYLEAAEEAQKVAEAAEAAAKEAQAAAEAAQAAAEEAAASAAEDKSAAEAAKTAAELAQAQAEAAKEAAEAAQAAAADAAKAAEESNAEAAKEAAAAAESAKVSAESAAAAAGSAQTAAEAAKNAQDAQASAEAAQAAAEDAAASAAEDKAAAETAQAAAELAQAQAEAAKAEALKAQDAAEDAAEAAEESNVEAAKQAAAAAEAAKDSAESAAAAVGSAQTAAEAAKNAQDAQAAAEAAQTAAEEAAESAAEDKAAAEVAKTAAELAKAQAEVAKTAAESAQTAAENAAKAAEESNVEAARDAALAADSAKASAESASAAASSAQTAAFAAKTAQDAQAKAEAAQKAAEEAEKNVAADKEAVEQAKKAAEEAAAQAAADKAAADKAAADAASDKAIADKAAAEATLSVTRYNALVELNEYADSLKEDASKVEKEALKAAVKAAREAINGSADEEAIVEALQAGIAALDEAMCLARNFADVDLDEWYHDAIDFALHEGIMNGYGDGTFGPTDSLTRAMLVQILYNIEGRPEFDTEKSFTDVSEGDWYYDAIMWAAENDIVLGYLDGSYGAKDIVTREQMVTILYRYAGKPEVTAAGIMFADSDQISDWAVDAVLWAYENKIVQGVGNKMFDPAGDSQRAAAAQIMMNYFTK